MSHTAQLCESLWWVNAAKGAAKGLPMTATALRTKRLVALEIGVGLVGTTATIVMRRMAAHRNDIDVESCMENLYRIDEISQN